MIPVDRDTSVNHNNQFTKSVSLPANVESDPDFDFDFSTPNAGASHISSPSNASASGATASARVNNDMLSPEEENKKSIEDFLGKIDSNLAKTKKYVKNR